MVTDFIVIFGFVFLAVVIMTSALYFSRYKQRHRKTRMVKSKKISVSCGACPGSVSQACKGHE